MKGKFNSMWRVVIAMVLVLSFSLVMAVPVSADVSGVTVTNEPDTISTAATYTVGFTTTAALFLEGPSTITVTFPDNTTVPDVNYADKVTVNDTACTTATGSPSARTVTINVPKDIAAGAVTVVIDEAAGVENPSTVKDTWTLTVKTSAEPVAVESATYSTTKVAPEIIEVAGTTYQNSNDVILITFSKEVQPVSTWLAAFPSETSIYCGATGLTLTGADFNPDSGLTETLLITLKEAEAYLVNGQTLKVTPVANQIKDALEVFVPAVEVTGSISGDSVAPAVALGYAPDQPVKKAVALTVTATFSEAMQASPTIAIDTTGVDLEATDMAGAVGDTVWTYSYDVPAGSDGTATVTISGVDLAGNANKTATNDTFVIDNTLPTIAAANIVGTTIQDAGDTIVITFSEPVTAEDADWTDRDEFTSILSGTRALTLTNATFAIDDADEVLTITLNEADPDNAYLVNGELITVTPASGAIKDAALNTMSTDAVEGTTSVSGDVVVPTIIKIEGTSATTIEITLSEAVLPADELWSSNEFALIENPDGAPVNISNATVAANDDPGTGMATLLTITLNTPIDGASLVAGEVICVTPASDAIVDLAGNPLAAVEVSSEEAIGWLEVWVDDDFTSATPSWGTTHFGVIQTAINAVAVGGTVNVAAGTYSEVVTIDKSLTLLGANADVCAGVNPGTRGPETIIDGTIRIAASNVVIDGIKLVNGGTVLGEGVGIYMIDQSHITVTNSILVGPINLSRSAMIMGNYAGSADVHSEDINVTCCESYDWNMGAYGNPGGGFSHDYLFQYNNFHDNSHCGLGLDVGDAFVLNNNIIDNGIGIEVFRPNVVAHFNNIVGNTEYGVYNSDTDVVDATNNWWGSPNGPGEDGANDVSGNVDYSPWLDAPYPYGEPTTTTGTYIDLVAGWNLISLPLYIPPENRAPVTLLAMVKDNIDIVWGNYDPTTGGWNTYVPAYEENDLTAMRDGKGYWVDMTVRDALDISTLGTELPEAPNAPPTYAVVVGWNLIGFKSTTPKLATDYLAAIELQYTIIYGFADGAYFVVQTEDSLKPGYGYWIAVTAAGTIYP